MGSVSATEQFLKHSPPLKKEIDALRDDMKNLLTKFYKISVPNNVIAIAGTATTLSCMNLGLKAFDEQKVEKSTIIISEINNLINASCTLTSKEILAKYGPVMNGREDIIFAGIIILSEIMNVLEIPKVIVSSRGIRYGAIVKKLNLNIKS